MPLRASLALLLLVAVPALAAPSVAPRTPPVIASAHHDMHGRLAHFITMGGELGAAARALDKVLLPHFRKEEAFALPPLALLGPLTTGPVTPAMRWALPMVERLKGERAKLIAEHRAIEAKLDALSKAGGRAKEPDAIRLAGEIRQHFRIEEAVDYPAALLVGERIKAAK